jgi:hypothetical protein
MRIADAIKPPKSANAPILVANVKIHNLKKVTAKPSSSVPQASGIIVPHCTVHLCRPIVSQPLTHSLNPGAQFNFALLQRRDQGRPQAKATVSALLKRF